MKKLACLLLAGIIVLSLFPVHVFAADKKQSVYAESSLQDKIYDSLLRTEPIQVELDYYKLRILKASISPVYEIDWEKYDEARKTEIKLRELESGKVYAAKLLNEKDAYAGSLIFSFGETQITELSFPAQPQDMPEGGGRIGASLSYADQAERIKVLLHSETIISPEDVRVVALESIGYAFYVHNENYDSFVAVGWVSSGTAPGAYASSALRDILSIQDIVENYNNMRERFEANEQEVRERILEAGYDYDYVLEQIEAGNIYFMSRFIVSVGLGDYVASEMEATPDIVDIEGYFKENVPGYGEPQFNSAWLWTGCAVCIGAVLGIVLIKRKKAKSTV